MEDFWKFFRFGAGSPIIGQKKTIIYILKSLEGIDHHKNTNNTNKFKGLYEIPWTFILIHRKYIFKAGKRRWKLLLATKRLHLVGKGDGNIRCTLQPMWKSIYLCESLKDSHEGYINVMINLISRLIWKLTQSWINTKQVQGGKANLLKFK